MRQETLTPQAVVTAAMVILDEFGLQDLTMRRLAGALDVKAGALYWHFPNKQTLLASVADQILAGLDVPEDETGIVDWLRTWAHRFRATLLRHRDAAELVASTLAMGLGAVDPCGPGRARLVELGMEVDDADATMQAHLHFVLGHTVEEQTRSQLVMLGVLEHSDDNRAARHFGHGVSLLALGVEAFLQNDRDGISIRFMA